MDSRTDTVCLGFSGLVLRFRFPEAIELPEAFQALACEDPGYADEEIQIKLLRQPLAPQGVPIRCLGYRIYHTEEGRLCTFPPLIAEDGCQVAFLLGPEGKNILYYPASRWSFYASPLNCRHLICGEAMLSRHDAFLIHSSVVRFQGKTVLFCGPSGIGKSTQAALWERELGAVILNGDRCLIRNREGVFYGGGSLWCGTSGVFVSDSAPIAGIFLLEQAEENRAVPVGKGGFSQLFRQCTLNSWDAAFMDRLTTSLVQLMGSVPVYRLRCRPDSGAVRTARDILF